MQYVYIYKPLCACMYLCVAHIIFFLNFFNLCNNSWKSVAAATFENKPQQQQQIATKKLIITQRTTFLTKLPHNFFRYWCATAVVVIIVISTTFITAKQFCNKLWFIFLYYHSNSAVKEVKRGNVAHKAHIPLLYQRIQQ